MDVCFVKKFGDKSMKLEIKQIDGSGYEAQPNDSDMNRIISQFLCLFIAWFFHIHVSQREKRRKKIQWYK